MTLIAGSDAYLNRPVENTPDVLGLGGHTLLQLAF